MLSLWCLLHALGNGWNIKSQEEHEEEVLVEVEKGADRFAPGKRLRRQSGTFVNPEPLHLLFEEYTAEFFGGKSRISPFA